MSQADVLPASGRPRRWQVGASLLTAALALCLLPGVAEAKKKRDKIGVATYNLYLGSDLGPATQAAVARRTDGFANEVGFVLSDVLANNFEVRAKHIARDIKKRKVDLVGLQEAALWKLQTPTDGSGLNPSAQRALNPIVDYIDTLLEQLNRKAKTAGECKKQGIPKRKCFRGYKLVVSQQEADLEFLGDFDNNPGPDGKTFDVSTSAELGAAAPSRWLEGNDDIGVSLGEPPALQCSDGRDNDGDGQTDWLSDPQCANNGDDSEATAGAQAGAAFPGDTNFDSHAFSSAPNALDATGAGRDPAGVEDCAPAVGDENPAEGPTLGENGLWPFAGYDGDFNPAVPGSQVPVCMFHGIDGDLSLTMRDAIIKRKGAGVKTKNSQGANFANKFSLPLFGGAATVEFTRGWTATDARVRGKSFRFVNTHLESESDGSIREDQASELVAPGGPADNPKVVLVGDLNSDPNRPPANLPDGDGGSNIAINRLFAAGFTSLVTTPGIATGSHGDHGDVINDPNDLLGEGWIDHILTNNPGAIKRKGKARILDGFEDGLWQSDHAGVLVRIKGRRR